MDRRTSKTRNALHGALLRLLTQRHWEEIDVQALCDEANVGRSTFYEHYRNREALLQQCFADIGGRFAEAGAMRVGSSTLPFIAPLVEHVGQQQVVFRVLLGRRSNAYVRQQFQSMLVELIRADLARHLLRPKWRGELLAHAVGGAVFATIHWWVSGNEPRKAEDIAAQINAHAEVMLRETMTRL
jgi:AcrR family transcriptional regulator